MGRLVKSFGPPDYQLVTVTAPRILDLTIPLHWLVIQRLVVGNITNSVHDCNWLETSLRLM
jgi:hypothetical protein